MNESISVLDIPTLKDLLDKGSNIVIHGHTGSGKTPLLNHLISKNNILHSETDVSRKYDGIKYVFPDILPASGSVGIDEIFHLDSQSLQKCIALTRTRALGVVLVTQCLESNPMPLLRQHMAAIYINCDLIDIPYLLPA